MMWARFAAIIVAGIHSTAVQAQAPGPQGAPSREQIWRIPSASGAPLLSTTIYRPRGNGPWPLMIANHGIPPADNLLEQFRYLTDLFVDRGYVVAVPWRRGWGPTGGVVADDRGPCNNPGYLQAGLQTAADIRAVLDYLRTQSFVLPDRAIVVGHSAGGWGTIALSSTNPPGVAGMVNVAGGQGGRCLKAGGGQPDTLVEAAARFGSTARVPMLWIYSANDGSFGHALARRMADAYNAAGGRADLRLVSAVGSDGHGMLHLKAGLSVWPPLIAEFLTNK